MSRVIPYIDIQEGRVPRHEDFEKAKSVFGRASLEALGGGAIVSAVIFGSVARGSAGPRSDMDVIIATANSVEGREAGRDIIQTVKAETKGRVPVNGIVKPAEYLASGDHEMDPHIGRHLLHGTRVVIGDELHIAFRDIPPEVTLARFLEQKIRRLETAHAGETPDEILTGTSLSRLLDLPVAVGRKSVQALGEMRGTGDLTMDSANRGRVIEQATDLFTNLGVIEGFMALQDIDAEYSKLLQDAQANRRVTEDSYNEALLEIFSSIPEAIDWLHQLKNAAIR